MSTCKKTFKSLFALTFVSLLVAANNPAQAITDFEARETYLKAKARAMNPNETDHSKHKPIDKSLDFHGVFYGYLPCNESDCKGVKVTLSLKQNNNYLLTTQPAKDSSREYYEKGKYTWNEDSRRVTLSPHKDNTIRQYSIEEEGVLIQLNDNNGNPVPRNLIDEYTLRRSDSANTREVHIH
jgi:uncharacterized lipoprotein NlpE involved in copper resistance